jgi:transposase
MASAVVGIDVSKDSLDVYLIDEQGQGKFLPPCVNSSTGFAQVASAIAEQGQAREGQPIWLILEPTGGYEQPLAHFAHEKGWWVSLPNPRQVRDWARGMGARSKTDRLDAQWLARYGRDRRPPLWRPMGEDVALLSDLLDRRQDLAQMCRQERNRVHALQGQNRYKGIIKTNIENNLERLETSLAEIEGEIETHLDDHPELKKQARMLQQVPGVGSRTVLPILVLCSRWSALTNGQGSAKALTAYVGLDPQLHESGRTVHRRATISRQGDPSLRQLLFMGALGGTHSHSSALHIFYERLLSAGKPKMVALVAASRKILVWCWGVFRDDKPFDPQLACARGAGA